MELPCLKDKDEYPDDQVLIRYLGEVKKVWDIFIDLIKENYPSYSTEWRYYNDGKSWLFKITRKKKTICWVSVYNKMFKTTFYLNDRAENFVRQSKLDQEYKDQFIQGKRYGKIRGLTVAIREPGDLETTKLLIDMKEKIK
jgi:hypothetical protein